MSIYPNWLNQGEGGGTIVINNLTVVGGELILDFQEDGIEIDLTEPDFLLEIVDETIEIEL